MGIEIGGGPVQHGRIRRTPSIEMPPVQQVWNGGGGWNEQQLNVTYHKLCNFGHGDGFFVLKKKTFLTDQKRFKKIPDARILTRHALTDFISHASRSANKDHSFARSPTSRGMSYSIATCVIFHASKLPKDGSVDLGCLPCHDMLLKSTDARVHT